MPRIKALLFDLDGTLTHTDPVHLRAIQHLLESEGRMIDETAFRTHVSGRSNSEIGERLFPHHPVEAHAGLLARKEALFREFATDLVPLAGAVELIAAAGEAGLRLALVTNAPRENVGHMLTALGVAEAFDTIVHGDEMERPKPDPLPYLTGLHRLGVGAEAALAFEDSLPGLRAAKAAGLFTIGLATSLTEAELTGAGADLVTQDYRDARLADLFAGGLTW